MGNSRSVDGEEIIKTVTYATARSNNVDVMAQPNVVHEGYAYKYIGTFNIRKLRRIVLMKKDDGGCELITYMRNTNIEPEQIISLKAFACNSMVTSYESNKSDYKLSIAINGVFTSFHFGTNKTLRDTWYNKIRYNCCKCSSCSGYDTKDDGKDDIKDDFKYVNNINSKPDKTRTSIFGDSKSDDSDVEYNDIYAKKSYPELVKEFMVEYEKIQYRFSMNNFNMLELTVYNYRNFSVDKVDIKEFSKGKEKALKFILNRKKYPKYIKTNMETLLDNVISKSSKYFITNVRQNQDIQKYLLIGYVMAVICPQTQFIRNYDHSKCKELFAFFCKKHHNIGKINKSFKNNGSTIKIIIDYYDVLSFWILFFVSHYIIYNSKRFIRKNGKIRSITDKNVIDIFISIDNFDANAQYKVGIFESINHVYYNHYKKLEEICWVNLRDYIRGIKNVLLNYYFNDQIEYLVYGYFRLSNVFEFDRIPDVIINMIKDFADQMVTTFYSISIEKRHDLFTIADHRKGNGCDIITVWSWFCGLY